MTNSIEQLPQIQVFLSYAHVDDDTAQFAEALQRGLETMVTGMSGRPCEVFRDRKSIKLGEDWQQAIREGVANSMVFIPVISGNYLKSDPCREEFLLFRQAADAAGVLRLLIPVVLLGFASLKSAKDDAIASYAKDHQSIDYSGAWVEGTDGPAFRKVLLNLVTRIIEATEATDEALADAEEGQIRNNTQQLVAGTPGTGEANELDGVALATHEVRTSSDGDDEDDDELGLVEAAEQLSALMENIQETTGQMGRDLSQLGDIESAPEGDHLTTADLTKYYVRVAQKFKGPANRIGEAGARTLRDVQDVDSLLRRTVHMLDLPELADQRKQFLGEMAKGVSEYNELEEVVDQMSDLLTKMRVAEVTSASIRRALRPARSGIKSMGDAVTIMVSWQELFPGTEV